MPTNRSKCALALAGAGLSLFLAGCRQDMHDQPKYKPLGEAEFFSDKRQSRPVLANTVARGDLRDGDATFYTGKDGTEDTEIFPMPVTKELVERGHERFEAFCSPCHGRLGNGLGMIVRRGMKQPPSYHIERLRTAPAGHFYDVITNGYGAMYNYASQISPRDRWAIVSYIRALQFSQNQKAADLPADIRAKLPAKADPNDEPILPGTPDMKVPAGAPAAASAKTGAMNE